MYISVPETAERAALKSAGRYLSASIFCAVFGAAYEQFSHGVYSYFMLYAFAFPLLLGVLPAVLAGLRGRETLQEVPRPPRRLWGAGVATLTAGSLVRGILDIYGTSSGLVRVYWIAGVALLLCSIAVRFYRREAAAVH